MDKQELDSAEGQDQGAWRVWRALNRAGHGQVRLAAQIWSDLDRKSTRLNSSHT